MKKLTVLQSLLVSFLFCVSLLGIYFCVVFVLPEKIQENLLTRYPITFFVQLGVLVLFFILFSVFARKWKFLGTVLLCYILLILVVVGGVFQAAYFDDFYDKKNPWRIDNQKDCEEKSGRVWINGKCLHACGEDQRRGEDGYCFHCPESSRYYISEIDCLKCPNTEFLNDYCIPKKCLNEKYPLKNIATGECMSCSSDDFRYSEEDCTRCDNREMKNGFCVFRNGMADVIREDKLWKIPYVNGIEHGKIEIYSLDGVLSEVAEKVNGVVQGEVKTFNKNGEVISIYQYKNGRKNGKWVYYPHAAGETACRFGVRQEMDLVDGKRDGLFRIFFDNGKIKQETQWKNDKENGYDRLYNEEGVLLMESEFKDGKMIRSFCYTDKGEKRELVGAAFTNFANGGIDTTCDD